ncbi:Gap junction alpha-4 protein, partial [Tauraco erythrolophus]
RILLTVVVIFRILIVAIVGETVYEDEQTMFMCNTLQPGCNQACYDKAFPISHIRYWVLQFLFVSTPTLIYLGHVVYLSRKEEKLKQQESELRAIHSKDPKIEQALAAVEKKMSKIYMTEDGRLKIRGALMWTYIISVICKSIFEAGFLVGQWYLYGFSMVPRYVCKRDPCPHQVDCFISRPTEKTIFIIFMLVMGLISL